MLYVVQGNSVTEDGVSHDTPCRIPSFEYARSYCNWLSLDRTARANGIKSTTRWLNEFFRAFTQRCLDWTLSKRSDETYTDSVNIQRYDEGAYAEFDFEPWLAWNWKPAADC